MQERYRSAWCHLNTGVSPVSGNLSVSVIIAARNEAHRVRPLLDALHRLDYPGPLEILIADDHSTDGTSELIRAHLPPHTRLLVPTGTGKRAALLEGLNSANGQIILLTDADSVVGPDWVAAMTHPFAHPGVHWVSGPVASMPGTDWVSRYDALEWQGLMVITGAGFAVGRPVLAQGANIAFRKSKLDQLGGLQALPARASGDDVFLLSLFRQHDPDSCHFRKDIRALVQTAPSDSWLALLQQRLRWTSKSEHLRTRDGLVPMALTWLVCVGVVATPVLVISLPNHLVLFAFMPILIKTAADYRLLHAGWLFSGARFSWMDVLTASLVQPLLVVISGAIGPLRPSYLWKGRRVR